MIHVRNTQNLKASGGSIGNTVHNNLQQNINPLMEENEPSKLTIKNYGT